MKRGCGNKTLPLAGELLAVDSCLENPFSLSVGPDKFTILPWRDTSKDTHASKLDLAGEKTRENKMLGEWGTEGWVNIIKTHHGNF